MALHTTMRVCATMAWAQAQTQTDGAKDASCHRHNNAKREIECRCCNTSRALMPGVHKLATVERQTYLQPSGALQPHVVVAAARSSKRPCINKRPTTLTPTKMPRARPARRTEGNMNTYDSEQDRCHVAKLMHVCIKLRGTNRRT